MKTIALRREDLDKKGEQRAAITPTTARELVELGNTLLVQPGNAPQTHENKRIFPDQEYAHAGAVLQEDLQAADIIFGLKEVDIETILPETLYLFFSHSHKGQKKNRKMLKTLVERRCSLIDYELITNASGVRLLTAFTYFAGYAGMIDTLWALGARLEWLGHPNPFSRVPQSIHGGGLEALKDLLRNDISEAIRTQGTPSTLPPLITCVLGRGKTSQGAQVIYDLLPHEEITMADLPHVYAHGSRHKVYKLVLEVHEMYRLKANAELSPHVWEQWNEQEKFKHYLVQPEMYESNLAGVLPYVTLLMNCIIWSPRYPRLVTYDLMQETAQNYDTLKVIGDISCDPNGAIEFSQETWIDQPLFTYEPFSQAIHLGHQTPGVVVMAVTNLPCEFSADASIQFAADLHPYLSGLLQADLQADFLEAHLPGPLHRATILWKGKFTPDYDYMREFL
jgi:alpha-aminoadipic semialdehyde synthase